MERSTHPLPAGFSRDRHLREISDQGYTIIEDFLDAATLAQARAGMERHLGRHIGRTDFEGLDTERVYTLVARGAVFERIAEDPRILALADGTLVGEYLLSVSQGIDIHPGEKAQGFHRDTSGYLVPPDYRSVTLGVIAAIDPFTAENGATEVLAGSHKWSVAQLARLNDARRDLGIAQEIGRDLRKIEMPAGACVVFCGTLIHRGGANRSKASRLALTNQYCEAWLRTSEAFHLSIPPDRVRRMSGRLKRLLGYEKLGQATGNLSGIHPARALSEGFVLPVVTEDGAP
jgi:ectoine hydroxylase-related dioxygenase (phytanoyl-CoA dioxygenase family)